MEKCTTAWQKGKYVAISDVIGAWAFTCILSGFTKTQNKCCYYISATCVPDILWVLNSFSIFHFSFNDSKSFLVFCRRIPFRELWSRMVSSHTLCSPTNVGICSGRVMLSLVFKLMMSYMCITQWAMQPQSHARTLPTASGAMWFISCVRGHKCENIIYQFSIWLP